MLANDKGKVKDDVTSWTGYPGGAPCNVACGLGKLGIPVAFVSSLGNDEKGDELLQLMQSTEYYWSNVVNTCLNVCNRTWRLHCLYSLVHGRIASQETCRVLESPQTGERKRILFLVSEFS